MSLRRLIRTRAYAPLKRLSSPIEIAKYLRTAPDAKVNLGCGRNLIPGWLNTDLFPLPGGVRLDVCRPWPIPDGAFDACLCEHLIEHLSRDGAAVLIREAFRTLRPGGWLRVVTPDLRSFAHMILDESAAETGAYVERLSQFTGRHDLSALDAVNEIFYSHGHRRIYTATALRDQLRQAGFDQVHETRGGRYVTPVFVGTDGHPKVIGQLMNEIEAFALEARKPALQ